MSKLTAEEVERKIIDQFYTEDGNELAEDSPWSEEWYAIEWQEKIEVPDLGIIEFVEQFGGEGKGDEYWIVFKINNQYFKVSAYYDSWNGVNWNETASLIEVEPKEVTKIEYIEKEL